MAERLDPEVRFFAKTRRSDEPPPAHRPDLLLPCLLWTDAALDDDGYPSFRGDPAAGEGRVRGHVWLMKRRRHVLRPGHTWDHACHDYRTCTEAEACRHRRCVEETHLEQVPYVVNYVLRSGSPAAVNARKDECDCGDSFLDPANVYHPPKRPTQRHCRRCQARGSRRHYVRTARWAPGPGQLHLGG